MQCRNCGVDIRPDVDGQWLHDDGYFGYWPCFSSPHAEPEEA